MSISQMVEQFCGKPGVFFAIGTDCFLRKNVKKPDCPESDKGVHIDYERHALDASAYGGLLWPILPVWNPDGQRLPAVGSIYRICD